MYGRTRFEFEIDQLGLGREFEVLDPGRNTHLDYLLRREKDWPQWRILALIKCGAIEIERQGGKQPAKKADEVIKKGEKVHIADPLSTACGKAVNQPAADTFRDYAFCPGTTGYHQALQGYLALRPQTLHLTKLDDLAAFVQALKDKSRRTHPMRHVILGAHAHEAGLLGLKMHAGSTKEHIALEDLGPSAKGVIEIPDDVFQPRPKDGAGAVIPAAVHIKGCRIGDNVAFLKALKKALGDRVAVTAPRHFHFFRPFTKNGKLHHLWEYMAYDFTVKSLTALGRDQVVDRYVNRKPQFVLLDGKTTMPRATWEAWIPARGWGNWTRRPDGYDYLDTEVDVVVPITGKKETLKGVAAVRYHQATPLIVPNIFERTKDPKTPADRKAIVRSTLDSNPGETKKLLEKHDLGSLDDVMAGDWRFEPRSRTDRSVAAKLYRHEYTVMRPVVDLATNTLFMNIFPPQKRTDAFELLESDKRLFGRA